MRHLLLVFVSMLSGCVQLRPADIPAPHQPGQKLVVFDIDGTLTPKNSAVFEVRKDAANAVNALSKKGYSIVYISARIPLFQAGLPAWLQKNGFPAGKLHVAQSASEREQVSQFKTSILQQYSRLGWVIAFAYGDSSTDFSAYADAGVARESVFALQRRGDSHCQPGIYKQCLDGWSHHLAYIGQEIPDAD